MHKTHERMRVHTYDMTIRIVCMQHSASRTRYNWMSELIWLLCSMAYTISNAHTTRIFTPTYNIQVCAVIMRQMRRPRSSFISFHRAFANQYLPIIIKSLRRRHHRNNSDWRIILYKIWIQNEKYEKWFTAWTNPNESFVIYIYGMIGMRGKCSGNKYYNKSHQR